MSDKQIITDTNDIVPVTPEVEAAVERGRAAGIEPEIAPRPATATNPRAHLPKYRGKMRGVLPDNHPDVIKTVKEKRAQLRRERERDRLAMEIEAGVDQKLRLGTKVVIKGNAKVDYEDKENGGKRVKGDYAGVTGEVYQTYVDHEGKRRYIIVDRENGSHSAYAPAGVRECDVEELERHGRRFHAVPRSPEQRAQLRAEDAKRAASMTQEDKERAMYGGLTAREMADKMCGL